MGAAAVIRPLFERATSLSLSTKKMKYLFKRFLEFEQRCGDEASQDHVRTKAREYVEAKMSA